MPAKISVKEIRKILLRYDGLRDSGLSHKEAALRLETCPTRLKQWKDNETEHFSVPGPWQGVHLGKRWTDMPGSSPLAQRCNFSLFRRGRLTLDAEGNEANPAKSRWRRRQPKKKKAVGDTTPKDMDIAAFLQEEE